MENYKNLYSCLLETEELFVVFSRMTGDWEKDKKRFIESQKEIEELANIKIIHLDDDSSEYID